MKTAGFFKRLLVIVYDALLLAAILLLSAIPLPLLPDLVHESLIGKGAKVIYFLAVAFLFFGWFWTHGGQTLGMKSWNLFVVDSQGKYISWRVAFYRYCLALVSWLLLGFGYTFILLNRRKQTLHDRILGTLVVYHRNTADNKTSL